MPMRLVTSLFALMVAAPLACAADAPPVAAAALAEQVRATEIAFAKTLAERDAGKFVSMIAPDIIWLAGDKTLRSPQEVLASWQKYFDAPQAPFSWAPELVEVQPGGQLALSTGPVTNAAGKRVGTFTSVWRREQSGEWKIIFDRGCPECDCAAASGAGQQQ
jgi:ketosteroid isomerase-like protein